LLNPAKLSEQLFIHLCALPEGYIKHMKRLILFMEVIALYPMKCISTVCG